MLEAWPAGIILWVLLWLNINSGHWRLLNPSGLLGYFHALRAVLPFGAAVLGVGLLGQRRARFRFSWSGPVGLMTIYGVVALGACTLSVAPFSALYWGLLYLSVFVVLQAVMVGEDSLERGSQLLGLTWLIVAALAVVLAVVARDLMFGRGGRVFSGHGIIVERPDVGGFGMSRSTGIGRFAALPAIVAFARLCHGKAGRRLLWAIPFCGFVVLVLAMQARSALFGLAAAVAFVLTVQRGKAGLLVAVSLVVLALLADITVPEVVGDYIQKRGPGEDFLSLSGRTEVWERGWELFLGSPVFGLGPLADRFHLGWEHVHNTWLFALMQSGVVGTIPFVASWVVGWRLFLRNIRRAALLPRAQRLLLIEAGAVLAFFTVRSVPETTAAGFSVDLLVIVPILAYLEVLHRSAVLAGPAGRHLGAIGAISHR